jgi:type IV secretion system protein VirB3
MRNTEAQLTINTLFVGLTRPPMIFGLTMNYFFISILIIWFEFLLFSSPLYLLTYVPLHVAGVIACAIDHNIFQLFFKKLECWDVPNKGIWGCQTYEPY